MSLNLLSKVKDTFEKRDSHASTKRSEDSKIISKPETVRTRAKDPTDAIFGMSPKGEVIHLPISEMPHMLVAGTTGSGKSVLLNELLLSMMVHASPDELKLAIIDPKKVEFTRFKNQPHMIANPVTDLDDAYALVRYMVIEMKRRYGLMERANGKKNIESYNKWAIKNGVKPLPYLVLLCDEFSQLMMEHREIEDEIVQLGQMARAAGMHLIIATQSPRTTVITGIIKANIPSRVSLMVASELESRIILDESGGEKLRPKGDMLIKIGGGSPIRAQGAFITDEEIDRITEYLEKKYGEPELVDFKAIVAEADGEVEESPSSRKGDFGGLKDSTGKRRINTAITKMDLNSEKPSIEKVSPFAMKLNSQKEAAIEKGEEVPDLPRLQAEKLQRIKEALEGKTLETSGKEEGNDPKPKLNRLSEGVKEESTKPKKTGVTSSPVMQMMMKNRKQV